MTSQDRQIIEPKSSKRLILLSDKNLCLDKIVDHTITIREPVSVQFKTNHLNEQNVNKITAVVRNNTGQPVCLLSGESLLTIETKPLSVESVQEDRIQSKLILVNQT